MKLTKYTSAIGAVFMIFAVNNANSQELEGTFKKIKSSGAIVIGHNSDSPPFSYIGTDGNPRGYSIDICNAIADALKVKLDMPNLTVKYQAVNGQTGTPLLVNGTIDMRCATTTHTYSRTGQMDFTSTIFVTGNQILTKKNSGIHSLMDLKGKIVSGNQGTTNLKLLNALNEKYNLGIKILSTEDQPQAWLALESGRSDAHMTDSIVEYGLIKKAKNPEDYAIVGDLLSFDPYAIVVRRDDTDFRSLANKVIGDLWTSGELEKIYDKWMGPIGVKLTPELKTLFSMQAFPE